ncbi:MAG: 50S ribosomal protein L24e [Candidatus Altarchaeaceae archaeon]
MQCSFCKNELKPGKGIMIVSSDGRVTYYCSSKCRKNAKLGRSPRKVEWTKLYAEEKKIRMKK